MDIDELNKYKWLDAQEVQPPTAQDREEVRFQKRIHNAVLNFLNDM